MRRTHHTQAAPPRPHSAADAVELTVVVPAHNEQDRLAATLAAVTAYLDADPATPTWELLVVDDGSTDTTADLAARAAAADPRVRLLRSPRNRGKGHAVRRGVLASRGRLVLFSDADLATPIAELDRLRAALAARSAGAAIGSRARPGATIAVHQHPAREALGRLGNRVIRAVAVPGVADTQCGFKLFEGERARRAFALARIDGWAFDVEILHLFRRFGWAVAEVPVTWSHRDGSKVRPLDYLRVLADVLTVRARLATGRAARGRGPAEARTATVPGARR